MSLSVLYVYVYLITKGYNSGGATPGRARSNDLAGRFTALANDLARTSTAMAPPCLLWTENNKKLIRRWDSERERSLRRHRAHTKNTIDSCSAYIFCHRSTRLCIGTQVYQVSEITQCNGHYAVQGHSMSPILVPIESSYTTSYSWLILTLHPILHRFQVMADYWSNFR